MKICPDCLERVGDDKEHCPRDGTRLREIHAREEDPMEGRVFDERWVVEQRIGGGGMGTVYRANQLSVDRTVAIKILRSSLCEDDEHVERFFREANLASNIDDPRCVTIFDFGQDPEDRALYLAMELLEGESLQERMRSQKLTLREALDVAIQVCEALETLHAQQIVHRDLKPENIFLVDDIGDGIFLKLLDFGLAKALDSESTPVTQTGHVYGTPAFMSPEQCMGTEVDPRADLYALGCILYLAISGRTPFGGDGSVQTLMAHVNREPPKLDGPAAVPAELERAVMRLLAKDPADRYPSAERLRERLEAIRDDLTGDPSADFRLSTIPPPEDDEEGGGTFSAAPTKEANATAPRRAEDAEPVIPEDPVDSSEETAVFDEGGTSAASDASAEVEPAAAPSEATGKSESGADQHLSWGPTVLLIVLGGAAVVVASEFRTGEQGAGEVSPQSVGEADAPAVHVSGGEVDASASEVEEGGGAGRLRTVRRRGRAMAVEVERQAVFAAAAVLSSRKSEVGAERGRGGRAAKEAVPDQGAARPSDPGERAPDPSEATGGSADRTDVGRPELLTRDSATRVFRSQNDAVRECLDGSVGPDIRKAAMVELELRVAGDGTVSRVDVRNANASDEDVECVTDLARELSFPPTTTGQPAQLVHRYRFEFEWESLE